MTMNVNSVAQGQGVTSLVWWRQFQFSIYSLRCLIGCFIDHHRWSQWAKNYKHWNMSVKWCDAPHRIQRLDSLSSVQSQSIVNNNRYFQNHLKFHPDQNTGWKSVAIDHSQLLLDRDFVSYGDREPGDLLLTTVISLYLKWNPIPVGEPIKLNTTCYQKKWTTRNIILRPQHCNSQKVFLAYKVDLITTNYWINHRWCLICMIRIRYSPSLFSCCCLWLDSPTFFFSDTQQHFFVAISRLGINYILRSLVGCQCNKQDPNRTIKRIAGAKFDNNEFVIPEPAPN